MNRDRMRKEVVDALSGIWGSKELSIEMAAELVVSRLRPPDRKIVVSIESPYRPDDKLLGTGEWLIQLRQHVNYARALYRFALLEGFAPFASHLNYAQPGILDDEIKAERWLGIDSGKALERAAAEQSWFGTDFPMSDGMRHGMADALQQGRSVRQVSLGEGWEIKWLGATRNRPI